MALTKPTTPAHIVTLALSHLKNDGVISIDPPDQDSKAAAAGAKWYEQARRTALEADPWKFASKRLTIPAENDVPAFEYSKKYELPADFVRVNRLGDDWRNPITDYEIEDGYILCNEPTPLSFVYVYDMTTITKMSPQFITYLSYILAGFMGYEITGNPNIVTVMHDLAKESLSTAAAIQGQNRPVRRVQHSRLSNARRNFGRFRGWQSWGDN